MSSANLTVIIASYCFIAFLWIVLGVQDALTTRREEELWGREHKNSQKSALNALLGVIWPVGILGLVFYGLIATVKAIPRFIKILRGV